MIIAGRVGGGGTHGLTSRTGVPSSKSTPPSGSVPPAIHQLLSTTIKLLSTTIKFASIAFQLLQGHLARKKQHRPLGPTTIGP